MKRLSFLVALLLGAGCGASSPNARVPELEDNPVAVQETEQAPIPAPPSGPARDISFPAITRVVLENGLEVNTVRSGSLPAVHLRLVIRSGAETDPSGREGLSNLVADMLREGTREHTSVEIAERIEFLGADLSVGADEENVHLVFRALSDQLDEALDILAELITEPAFRADELEKLKRRENDRLVLSSQRPGWLARREVNRRLYGAQHPYGTVDTTAAALRRIRRTDLVRWHRANMTPNNSFLVVVGAVDPATVQGFGDAGVRRLVAAQRARASASDAANAQRARDRDRRPSGLGAVNDHDFQPGDPSRRRRLCSTRRCQPSPRRKRRVTPLHGPTRATKPDLRRLQQRR